MPLLLRFHDALRRSFAGFWVFAFLIIAVLVTGCVETTNVSAAEKSVQQNSDHPPAKRIPWETSRLSGTPEAPLPFRVQRVFEKLTFQSPMTLRDLPGRAKRIVLERKGRIVTFDDVDDPTSMDVAIDLGKYVKENSGEDIAAARDLAIDPNFDQNGWIYVVWAILPHETEGGTRVSRLTLDQQSPPKIDPDSRLDIITYPSGDHIGASLRFGPDGLLYVTTGDGARPFPPDVMKTAQNVGDLRGGVLRIDVRGATEQRPYRIPSDNPFVGMPGSREEVYAIGIRNGFRSAFDPATGDFWVADVGWERCEMVHRIEPGGNHGWSMKEGPYDVDTDQQPGPGLSEAGEPITPAIEMLRDEAQSITGGVFDQNGEYLFGCYMNGTVWSANVSDVKNVTVRRIARSGLRIIDFANITMSTQGDTTTTQSVENAVVIVDFGSGGIYRLIRNEDSEDQSKQNSFPRTLSQTGLFADCRSLTPADGVLVYQPAATMFRNGAESIHMVAIPGDKKIIPHNWLPNTKYPKWTAFVNTILRDVVDDSGQTVRRPIETQVLLYDGLIWNPYTYRWNDDQSDATLVPESGDQRKLTVPDTRLGDSGSSGSSSSGYRVTTHRFASRAQCATCHSVSLPPIKNSFTPEQLNSKNKLGEEPQETSDQIGTASRVYRTWQAMVDAGYVEKLNRPKKSWLINPKDESFSLEDRARSYLAVNCSCCHRPNGGAAAALNLLRNASLEDTSTVDQVALQGDFGLTDAKTLVPGHPERSVMMYRIATNGPGKMPKLGSDEPDLQGAKLVWDWIASMDVENSLQVGSGNNGESATKGQDSEKTTTQAMIDWHANLARTKQKAQLIAQAYTSTDPVSAGLFEPWIEPSQRTTRVGASPDVAALLAIPGDAKRGQVWFADAASAQCRSCHSIRPTNPQALEQAAIGPTLLGIGSKRTPADLLDQILNPSKVIDEAWRSYIVLTVDGEFLSGLKVRETDDEIVLRAADGQQRTIATDEIESIRPQSESIMPAGLCESMTPQEVADLIAYLASLK